MFSVILSFERVVNLYEMDGKDNGGILPDR